MWSRRTWAAVALALGLDWTAAAAPQGLRPFPKPIRKAPLRDNLVDRLMHMTPDEQRDFMRNSPRFHRLPPRQQEIIQRRLEEFNKLPPTQREALRERYELFQQLPPEKQDRARALFRQWNQQPADRRPELRKELRQLREATPEERKLRLESEEFRNRFSEEEREILRGLVELGTEPRP
jgi:hypothetical protein